MQMVGQVGVYRQHGHGVTFGDGPDILSFQRDGQANIQPLKRPFGKQPRRCYICTLI